MRFERPKIIQVLVRAQQDERGGNVCPVPVGYGGAHTVEQASATFGIANVRLGPSWESAESPRECSAQLAVPLPQFSIISGDMGRRFPDDGGRAQQRRRRASQRTYSLPVQPAIHVITLGVADLERSLTFYRALGLKSPGVIGTEFPGGAATMFALKSGLILALYGRADLASDANTTFDARGSGEFSIGHLVGSRDEVDGVLAEATAAGATLTEEPHDRPWGIYSGYFRDPDGHLWEVIWNPRVDALSI